MEFGKKIVIAIDLNETTKSQVSQLKKLNFLKDAEIHFVHVFQTTIMTSGLGDFCQIFPVESDRREIEEALQKNIKSLYEGYIDGTKVQTRILFDQNPKQALCIYAGENKVDTIIIFTRERHGIFESSFAQYAARHSPCHVVILKP